MKNRIFIAVLLTSVLLLAFFSITLAKEPVVEKYDIANSFSIPCDNGAFKVDFVESGVAVVSTFFDKEGNWDRTQLNFTARGTGFNTDTKTTYEHHASINEFFEPGGAKFIGVLWHLTVPGKGVIVIDVGRLVFDEFGFVSFSGHTEPEFTVDDITLICDGVRGI